MGTLTFAELKEEVRAGLLARTDTDSRLGRFVNMAQQRLARLHDFDEMEVISESALQYEGEDSDRFIELPTLRECYSLVLLDGANSRKLIGATVQWMDRMQPKPEYWSRDWPTHYSVWGTYIEVFPLPRAAYDVRLRWTQWPLALSEDTDVSQFNNKDELLIELSLSYAYRSLGKEEDAAKHEAFAKSLLAEAKEQDRSHPDRNIIPSPSDSAISGSAGSEPWNDPFVRSTNA